MMNISLILLRLFKNFKLVPLRNALLFMNALFVKRLINLKLLVNPDFVLHAVKNIPLFGLKTASSLIDVKHRAVLFTIPKELREFFFYDRNLLTKLTYAINDIFQYQFHNIKRKNERVHKIGKYSKKYFTNSDILHYGLITVIHTFGRDLK